MPFVVWGAFLHIGHSRSPSNRRNHQHRQVEDHCEPALKPADFNQRFPRPQCRATDNQCSQVREESLDSRPQFRLVSSWQCSSGDRGTHKLTPAPGTRQQLGRASPQRASANPRVRRKSPARTVIRPSLSLLVGVREQPSDQIVQQRHEGDHLPATWEAGRLVGHMTVIFGRRAGSRL